MSYLDACIEAAQKLGGLSAAAIFAFSTIALAYDKYRRDKEALESSEKWRMTREGQIRAEEAQTMIVTKLVDVVAMNTSAINLQKERVDHLATLIDERIPRRSNA